MSFDIGDTAQVTATFRVDGALADPTAVTCAIQAPSGTASAPAAIRESLGVYSANVTLSERGLWTYTFVGTGDAAGVVHGVLRVLAGGRAQLDVLARVRRLTAADHHPVLSDEDLAELVTRAQRLDTAGLTAADDDWVPTYDVDAAVAAGWEMKAARAASGFAFTEDGQSFRREQVFEQCVRMAKVFSRGGGSTVVASEVGDTTAQAPLTIDPAAGW